MMNAREAAQLLREKLPEGTEFTVREEFSRAEGIVPFCVFVRVCVNRVCKHFDLPSQPVTDFTTAARAAIDWALTRELAKGDVEVAAVASPKQAMKQVSPVHFAESPFVALCGADKASQTTTQVRENVTCTQCSSLLLNRNGPVKATHEWRVDVTDRSILRLFENDKPVGMAFKNVFSDDFYWRAEPMQFACGKYCPTLDAAKAACIAKRLEVLEAGEE